MSLFSDPEEHAANPPATWHVVKAGRCWSLRTAGGTALATFKTKTAAEAARTNGFHAEFYADESRWYAGESVRGWLPYRARPASSPTR